MLYEQGSYERANYSFKLITDLYITIIVKQMVSSSEDGDSVSSLVWWRVPTAATVRALYALAYSVAQPSEHNGLVHSDDVICKCC